jgi:hypothetical protein
MNAFLFRVALRLSPGNVGVAMVSSRTRGVSTWGSLRPCDSLPLSPLCPLPGGAWAAPQGSPPWLQQWTLCLHHDATCGSDHGTWHVSYSSSAAPACTLSGFHWCIAVSVCCHCPSLSCFFNVNTRLWYETMLGQWCMCFVYFCMDSELCVCCLQSSWACQSLVYLSDSMYPCLFCLLCHDKTFVRHASHGNCVNLLVILQDSSYYQLFQI